MPRMAMLQSKLNILVYHSFYSILLIEIQETDVNSTSKFNSKTAKKKHHKVY